MNEKQTLINFDTFKEHQELVRYIDKDIVIVENLSSILDTREETYKLDCFMIIFCLEGEILTDFNNQKYLLKPDHCAVLLPGTLVRRSVSSQSFVVRIVAFSQDFYSATIQIDPNTWNIVHYLYDHPILPITSKESYKMYLFKEAALQLMEEAPHPFSHLVKHHFFACVFCEILAHFNEIVPDTDKVEYNHSRQSQIFRQFIEEVVNDDGTHRSVTYYANRLCCSPKHFSTVIKQYCGKSPIKIINEHAIQKIKYQLKHSDMTIKEIADYFEFANPSFFGKFVKQHIGMSPMQYRIMAE